MPQVTAPRWSPDGKQIAYVVSKADLAKPVSIYDTDVWLIDADGKNDRRLTFASGADFRPRWSPDGTRLAFLSDRGGRNAIYLLDPRGGEARALTNEPTPIREFEWSPDGKQIAFTRIDEPSGEGEPRVVGQNERAMHLYVVDVETGKSRQLTNDKLSTFHLSWSPDGSELAISRAAGSGLDALHATDLHLLSMRDGSLRPLVVRPGHDNNPRFSPDGKSIVFTSAGGVGHWLTEFDLHVVPARGGTPRKVSAGYDRTPDGYGWTADSRGLWIEGPFDAFAQVSRVNADGTGFTKVLSDAWDADVHGERVAYIRQTLTSPPELYVDQRQLTHHNDAYRNREIGETRLIRWKNPKDGLEIDGFLTLPVGYKSGRVPLLRLHRLVGPRPQRPLPRGEHRRAGGRSAELPRHDRHPRLHPLLFRRHVARPAARPQPRLASEEDQRKGADPARRSRRSRAALPGDHPLSHARRARHRRHDGHLPTHPARPPRAETAHRHREKKRRVLRQDDEVVTASPLAPQRRGEG